MLKTSKTSIIWLCVAHFVCDIYGGFFNPLMPFIASKLGFTMSLATILLAITQICSNMLQPIFGFFADNILKRFFIFWGIILSSIFIPLATNAPNIKILVLFLILGCLGGSFFHPQAMGFINIFSDKNKSKNMGIFISLGSLGFAFGPLLAMYITQMVGLEKIFFTSILGILIALLMFLFVPKLSTTVPVKQKLFIKTFKDIFSNTQMINLLIIAMMKSLVTTSSCILLPFLWKSMGYAPFYIGLALFLFVAAGAFGSLVSPYLEKSLSSKTVIYFSLYSSLPLLTLFTFTYKTMPILSMIIFSFVGFTTMLAQPVILIYAQKILPEYKSVVSGFVNGFCWGVIAFFTSFTGIIAEIYGITNVLLVLSAIPIIASICVKNLKTH